MTKEYILLAHAHVNQITAKGVKGDWKIEANKTNDLLGTLPNSLDESQVFSIMDFVREYELIAFNVGIALGKEKQKEIDDRIELELTRKLEIASEENERLAEVLDKLTRNKE